MQRRQPVLPYLMMSRMIAMMMMMVVHEDDEHGWRELWKLPQAASMKFQKDERGTYLLWQFIWSSAAASTAERR